MMKLINTEPLEVAWYIVNGHWLIALEHKAQYICTDGTDSSYRLYTIIT